jgi:hypothetical protein
MTEISASRCATSPARASVFLAHGDRPEGERSSKWSWHFNKSYSGIVTDEF